MNSLTTPQRVIVAHMPPAIFNENDEATAATAATAEASAATAEASAAAVTEAEALFRGVRSEHIHHEGTCIYVTCLASDMHKVSMIFAKHVTLTRARCMNVEIVQGVSSLVETKKTTTRQSWALVTYFLPSAARNMNLVQHDYTDYLENVSDISDTSIDMSISTMKYMALPREQVRTSMRADAHLLMGTTQINKLFGIIVKGIKDEILFINPFAVPDCVFVKCNLFMPHAYLTMQIAKPSLRMENESLLTQALRKFAKAFQKHNNNDDDDDDDIFTLNNIAIVMNATKNLRKRNNGTNVDFTHEENLPNVIKKVCTTVFNGTQAAMPEYDENTILDIIDAILTRAVAHNKLAYKRATGTNTTKGRGPSLDQECQRPLTTNFQQFMNSTTASIQEIVAEIGKYAEEHELWGNTSATNEDGTPKKISKCINMDQTLQNLLQTEKENIMPLVLPKVVMKLIKEADENYANNAKNYIEQLHATSSAASAATSSAASAATSSAASSAAFETPKKRKYVKSGKYKKNAQTAASSSSSSNQANQAASSNDASNDDESSDDDDFFGTSASSASSASCPGAPRKRNRTSILKKATKTNIDDSTDDDDDDDDDDQEDAQRQELNEQEIQQMARAARTAPNDITSIDSTFIGHIGHIGHIGETQGEELFNAYKH
jgi:hypothetical protein